MSNIQLIQLTPNELANIISAQVKQELQALAVQLHVPKIQHDKPHLTKEEAAEFFDVSVSSITNWSRIGLLQPYKMGNRTFFLRTDCLNALLDSRRA